MSTSNDPLWLLIAMAYDSSNAREGAAAVLRVIADEVMPEVEKPELFIPSEFGGSIINADKVAEWKVTQRIRQRLLTEADRAEAGE